MDVIITMFISILPLFIMGLIVIIAIKSHMKKINAQKEEFKKLPSVRVELYDLLHIMKKGSDRNGSFFLAVYKDSSNGRLYIPGRTCHLANPLVGYSHIIGSAPKITVKSHNSKQVEPNAKGSLHISSQLGNVTVEGINVTIGEFRCTYKGSVHELTSLNPVDRVELRNSVDNPRLLEELQNATIVDGLIEFDVDMYQE